VHTKASDKQGGGGARKLRLGHKLPHALRDYYLSQMNTHNTAARTTPLATMDMTRVPTPMTAACSRKCNTSSASPALAHSEVREKRGCGGMMRVGSGRVRAEGGSGK